MPRRRFGFKDIGKASVAGGDINIGVIAAHIGLYPARMQGEDEETLSRGGGKAACQRVERRL